MKRIKVLIADSNHLLKEDHIDGLSQSEGVEIVGITDTAHKLFELIGMRKPEIVLIDTGLHDGGDAHILTEILNIFPRVRCIAMVRDTVLEYNSFESIAAGAAGLLVNDTTPNELLDSIKIVHEGGAILSPKIVPAFFEEFKGLVRKKYKKVKEIESK
ncbi:MAG: hypothetical protein AMS17_04230 [Spirochaetes bacterium DG_61]|jgi:DNA-binding NarL/FixJ family response regulator|nr:MAG: hypothetical protein AMS17_04230 [Spirochaetes bacterium DG_61]